MGSVFISSRPPLGRISCLLNTHSLDKMSVDPAAVMLYLSIAYVGWSVSTWIYNLYFHPLAKFPGPKVAGMTCWWRIWSSMVAQDVIPKLIELHAEYGTRFGLSARTERPTLLTV